MRSLLLDGTESVWELADRMEVTQAELVRVAFERLGLMLSASERRDRSEVERVAQEFGYRVRWLSGSA